MAATISHSLQLSQLRLRSITAGLDDCSGVVVTHQPDQGTFLLGRQYGDGTVRTVEVLASHVLALARLESDHPARAPIAATPLHVPAFGGSTFDPERDEVRLNDGLRRVLDLMRDGHPRTLAQIALELTEGGKAAPSLPGISARLRDLRKPQHGGHRVTRFSLGGGLHSYRLDVGPQA